MDNLLDLVNWLLEEGNPVIRWRVAREIVGDHPREAADQLLNSMLGQPDVQTWLGRLTLDPLNGKLADRNEETLRMLGWMVHGSFDRCLENVLGKLAEFGLAAGIDSLDDKMLPLMDIFRWGGDWDRDAFYQYAWEHLVVSIFAWGLLRMGYRPDEYMKEYLRQYLEHVHRIARDAVFDIYADDVELVGLPKAWEGKEVMKQEIMENYKLPSIHDMYLLAHYPLELLDERAEGMIADVVSYVLDPRFQALRDGYGYAWIKERNTCYSWGWSPHLPGYHGFGQKGVSIAMLVQRLELMAHFPSARQTSWFLGCLDHLEGFKTDQGTYRFPASYLRESQGYYVSGYHMGLGENRRRKNGLEIESTFRMLKIRSVINA